MESNLKSILQDLRMVESWKAQRYSFRSNYILKYNIDSLEHTLPKLPKDQLTYSRCIDAFQRECLHKSTKHQETPPTEI